MWLWAKPAISTFVNEFIIIQFRIGLIDAINLVFLSGAQLFVGIQAPDALE